MFKTTKELKEEAKRLKEDLIAKTENLLQSKEGLRKENEDLREMLRAIAAVSERDGKTALECYAKPEVTTEELREGMLKCISSLYGSALLIRTKIS